MSIETEARVAAKWWADEFRTCKLSDNGDGQQSMLLSLSRTRLTKKLTPDDIDKFEELLYQDICNEYAKYERVEHNGNYVPALTLRVDYHPDKILRKAYEEAFGSYSSFSFPCKTTMWVRAGEVKVAAGYRAPTEYLIGADDGS